MDRIPERLDLLDLAQRRRVHLVSLGCPKNRVDSEVMIGLMQGGGYELTSSPEEADVIVVNTCAFIESAKEESIETILEMAEFKQAGSAERLVVTGCMAQRYGAEMAEGLPEVDYFLGTNEYKRIAGALDGTLPDRSYITAGSALYTSDEDRINTLRGGSAYLKIAEGCNRTCTFCIIPKIRGKQVSRPVDDLVREARTLAASGIRELHVIAQDLTSYGVDFGERDALVKLLRRLETVRGLEWVRLHYAYPWNFTDELLELLRADNNVLPYVDMPLQHISDHLLRAMRRNVKRDAQRRLLERLREIPGMVLRTTFITGFPGETEADFQELHDWVAEVEFDRVGVFAYSREENTDAAELPDQVPTEIAEERRDALMTLQAGISRRRNEAYIGRRLRVLVDGVSEEHEFVLEGRHAGQALDIDGVTYLNFAHDLAVPRPGTFVQVEIEDASEYDLVGTVLPG